MILDHNSPAIPDAFRVEVALRHGRLDEARRLSVGVDFNAIPLIWFLYVPQSHRSNLSWPKAQHPSRQNGKAVLHRTRPFPNKKAMQTPFPWQEHRAFVALLDRRPVRGVFCTAHLRGGPFQCLFSYDETARLSRPRRCRHCSMPGRKRFGLEKRVDSQTP
jgi:hypothetical protein